MYLTGFETPNCVPKICRDKLQTPSFGASPQSSGFEAQDRPSGLIRASNPSGSSTELWGFAPKRCIIHVRSSSLIQTSRAFEPFGFKPRALGLRPKTRCIVQARSSSLIQTPKAFEPFGFELRAVGLRPTDKNLTLYFHSQYFLI